VKVTYRRLETATGAAREIFQSVGLLSFSRTNKTRQVDTKNPM
jgi:hypothetical protein